MRSKWRDLLPSFIKIRVRMTNFFVISYHPPVLKYETERQALLSPFRHSIFWWMTTYFVDIWFCWNHHLRCQRVLAKSLSHREIIDMWNCDHPSPSTSMISHQGLVTFPKPALRMSFYEISNAYKGTNHAVSTPNRYLCPRKLFSAFAWWMLSLQPTSTS